MFTTLCGYGGDEENRTPDPLLARQVLSQLSYTPKSVVYYRSVRNLNNRTMLRYSSSTYIEYDFIGMPRLSLIIVIASVISITLGFA